MARQSKAHKWDGPNKRRARSCKVTLVRQDIEDGLIPEDPRCLTFAGSKAHFEKALVARGVAQPEDIVTIQTARMHGSKHNGDKILRALIKERNKSLDGMSIWPENFHQFSLGYKGPVIRTPPVRMSNPSRWYKCPTFKREMDVFLDMEPEPFDVLDIDICGVFGTEIAEDIARLMHNNMLSDSGLLFVNHSKGRDLRSGMMQFFKEYFHNCKFFDVNKVEDEEGRLDLTSPSTPDYYFARYRLVPLYYTIEAYKAGYILDIDRIIEYRDRNKNNAGQHMLQWYFRFKRRKSFKLGQSKNPSMSKLSEALREERATLNYLVKVIGEDEAYPWYPMID